MSLTVTNDLVQLEGGGHGESTKQMMKGVQMAGRDRITNDSDK